MVCSFLLCTVFGCRFSSTILASFDNHLNFTVYFYFMVCPSCLFVSLSTQFLGTGSLVFLHFGMQLETHTKLCLTGPGFLIIYFTRFFFFFFLICWNDFNFSWMWSIMKAFIMYLIVAHIPYFAKILFLRYRPKCSWSLNWRIFKLNSLIFCILIQIHGT